MARGILKNLRPPRALEEHVAMLIAYHGVTRDLGRLQSDQPVRRLLRRLGEKALRDLLALDRADDLSLIHILCLHFSPLTEAWRRPEGCTFWAPIGA